MLSELLRSGLHLSPEVAIRLCYLWGAVMALAISFPGQSAVDAAELTLALVPEGTHDATMTLPT